jgi:hypothetical protein
VAFRPGRREPRLHMSGAAESALTVRSRPVSTPSDTCHELCYAYRMTRAAYDAHPLDQHDEWGDLASFRAAADAS